MWRQVRPQAVAAAPVVAQAQVPVPAQVVRVAVPVLLRAEAPHLNLLESNGHSGTC